MMCTQTGEPAFGHSVPAARCWRHGSWAYGLFPIELAAFGTLLWQAQSLLAMAVVPIALLSELLRARLCGWRILIVRSAPPYRHAMHEYYMVFYPMGFLLAASARTPAVVVVLVAHAALFPVSLSATAREISRTLVQLLRGRFPTLRSVPTVPWRRRASRQNPVVNSAEP
jgi:hypothetical protein